MVKLINKRISLEVWNKGRPTASG